MTQDKSSSMKVVIFAGGEGSRLSEETGIKPKPMVEIGGMPILWHIMKIYSHYGYKDFVVCLGYKGNIIKEWFSNYFLYNSDVTFDLSANKYEIHNKRSENWRVSLIDTGLAVNTATRLARIQEFVGDGDFMLTYGDGLSDINMNELVAFHKSHDKIATITAVRPEGRFGSLEIGDNHIVKAFSEKAESKNNWINGGFFVLRPAVFDYLPNHDVMWEKEPLEKLAERNQLASYRHHGFWKAMDTLRDKRHLEELWSSSKPPWKLWDS